MQVVDISAPLSDRMPRYPSPYIPEVRLVQAATHEKEGRSVQILTCGTHVSTHIDAPFHAVPGGLTLDCIPVSNFVGVARILRFPARDKLRPLDRDDFAKVPDIDRCRKLVIDTGWGTKSWGTDEYFTEGPFLTRAAAGFLAGLSRLHLIGIDFPNIDSVLDMKIGIPAPNHQILLGRNILLLENLLNLETVADLFFLCAAPPRLVGSDGCPCRAIAMFPLNEMAAGLREES